VRSQYSQEINHFYRVIRAVELALKGLKRILERNRFTISPTTEELREEYMRKSNPIGAFMTDCVKADSEEK